MADKRTTTFIKSLYICTELQINKKKIQWSLSKALDLCASGFFVSFVRCPVYTLLVTCLYLIGIRRAEFYCQSVVKPTIGKFLPSASACFPGTSELTDRQI